MTRKLTEGLVGEHRALYETNVEFHVAIDELARLLPAMINGIAGSAIVNEEKQARALELLESTPDLDWDRLARGLREQERAHRWEARRRG